MLSLLIFVANYSYVGYVRFVVPQEAPGAELIVVVYPLARLSILLA